MKKIYAIAILSLCFLAFGAWAHQSTPDARVYGQGNSMSLGNVLEGTVIDVRAVRIEASNTATWTGRTTGAVLGGLLGSRVGQGNGRIAAGTLGGVLGAVAGDVVADKAAGYDGTELVISLGNGRTVSVTQAGATSFGPGAPVYVIQTGGTVRVVPRSSSAPAAGAPSSNGAMRPAADVGYLRYTM